MKFSLEADVSDLITPLTKGTSFLKQLADNKSKELGLGFQTYLTRTAERLRVYKTILSSTAPSDLIDEYVPLDLSCESKIVTETDLISSSQKYCHSVLQASAGAGKSIYLRWLFFKFLERGGEIPLFFELRHFNVHEADNLVAFLVDQLNLHMELDEDTLLAGFEKNGFILLLDGLDEIDFDRREEISAEINQLAETFPKLKIIVTSRPHQDFQNWPSFYEISLMPLTKEKVTSLIDNINFYDKDLKMKFIEEINDSLFDSHRFFLETPLLAHMMFLTRTISSEISDKMHIFYKTTYEALYSKHDAMKGSGFQRKKHSNFDIEEFARFFSFFCCSTYVNSQMLFTKDELIQHLTESLEFFLGDEIEENQAKEFMHDAIEASCILIQDGDIITFVHRSFQEYFTAFFLANYCDEGYFEIVEKIAAERTHDQTIGLLANMNIGKFERLWLIKKLPALIQTLPSTDDKDYIKLFWEKFFPEWNLMSIVDDEIRLSVFRESKNNDDNDDEFVIYQIISNCFLGRTTSPELRNVLLAVSRGELPASKSAKKKIEATLAGNATGNKLPFYNSDSTWQSKTWLGISSKNFIEFCNSAQTRIEKQISRTKLDIAKIAKPRK
ncbi:MAG: NACHT domain-containing protein [Aquisalinus sp.]|nr:NACHT domain-containing protein [Aquisalinus sp.]